MNGRETRIQPEKKEDKKIWKRTEQNKDEMKGVRERERGGLRRKEPQGERTSALDSKKLPFRLPLLASPARFKSKP